ncbi:hypothetical protein RB213_016121 [Colletotrichum asianum]
MKRGLLQWTCPCGTTTTQAICLFHSRPLRRNDFSKHCMTSCENTASQVVPSIVSSRIQSRSLVLRADHSVCSTSCRGSPVSTHQRTSNGNKYHEMLQAPNRR